MEAIDFPKWVRTKDSLYYLAPESGASVEEARGVLIGQVSTVMDIYHVRQEDAFDLLIHLFPDNFRIQCIPPSWLGMDRPFRESVLDKITSFEVLWSGLPDEEKGMNDALRHDLMCRYINLIPMLAGYAERAQEPDTRLYPFTKHGSQWIADWAVKDLSMPNDPSKRNFHMQNTSQWVFAGCLLVQDGRVSVHT
jgi:hypothetical protein